MNGFKVILDSTYFLLHVVVPKPADLPTFKVAVLVKLRRKHLSRCLWGGMLCILLLALLLGYALPKWQEAKQLQQGIETRAEITDLQAEEKSYYITYSFADATGQDYTRSTPISRTLYNRLEDRHIVVIRYLPDQPEVSEIVFEASSPTNEIIYLIVSGVTGIISLGLAGWAFYNLLLLRRVARLHHGQLIPGTITVCSAELIEKSDIKLYNILFARVIGSYKVTVHYEFLPPDGSAALHGTAIGFRNDPEYRTPQAGTPVYILYTNDKTYELL